MKIKCNNCQAEIDAEENFCKNCGAEINKKTDDNTKNITNIKESKKHNKKIMSKKIIILLIIAIVIVICVLVAAIFLVNHYTKSNAEKKAALEVIEVMNEYKEVKDSLSNTNAYVYEDQVNELESILEKVEDLKATEYPELKEYVDKVAFYNSSIRAIIAIDREYLDDYSSGMDAVQSVLVETSLNDSLGYYNDFMGKALDVEFPSEFQKYKKD